MKIAFFAAALVAAVVAQPAEARPHNGDRNYPVAGHNGGYGSYGNYRDNVHYSNSRIYVQPRYDRYYDDRNYNDRYYDNRDYRDHDYDRHQNYNRHSRRDSNRHNRRGH